MSFSLKCVKFILGAVLVAGCDDKKNAVAPTPDDKTKTPVADDTSKPVVVPKTPSTEPPKTTTTDTSVKLPSSGTIPSVRERATTLLTELKSAIDRGKLADADASLKQLEAMKDQLPSDLSAKLDTLRSAYKAWPTGAPR